MPELPELPEFPEFPELPELPEFPEFPEIPEKLTRIRGYDHSEVMPTIVFDWKPTLDHLGVSR